MPPALVTTTDPVAVGVTVVATVVVIALVAAFVYLLHAVRALRRDAQELKAEAEELLAELDERAREARAEVDRVDRMVGSAEAISQAVGAASRLVGGAVAEPLIKVVAVATGLSRIVQAFRGPRSGREIPAVSHERQRPGARSASRRRLHALDRGRHRSTGLADRALGGRPGSANGKGG